MFSLVIVNGGSAVAQYGTLRDARAALTRYLARRGLRLTIDPWDTGNGVAYQAGDLMSGMDVIGQWSISYPVEGKVSA